MKGERTMELEAVIQGYRPWNGQEEQDRASMLQFLARNPTDALLRENRIAHFTASVWVVNPQRTKTLMIYHKLYDSWSWIGGHADGEADLRSVALRELEEETGVKRARLAFPEPCSLEQLPVAGHMKRGVYVPSHLHLNLTWLAVADEGEKLSVCPEENAGVRWFTAAGALAASSEAWMAERIYKKLIERWMG